MVSHALVGTRWMGILLVCTIPEIVHDDTQMNRLVWLAEDRFLVVRYQSHIVELIKLIYKCGIRERLRIVVCQPPGYVVVQIIGKRVEQGL